MIRSMLFIALFCAGSLFAAYRDARILTDNTPDWTDLASAARSMTANLPTDEQKAIALWKWCATMRHQVSPVKDSFSLAASASAHPTYGIIYNPVKIAQNYGNTFCVSTNSFPALIWKHLGKQAQEYDIYGHTVADLRWDNAWHNFDPAFGFYYRDSSTGAIVDCSTLVARFRTMQNLMSDVTKLQLFNPSNQTNASIYEGKTVYNILNGTAEYSLIESMRTSLFTERFSDNYAYRLHLKPFESYTRRWTQIAPADIRYFMPANVTLMSGTNPNTQYSRNILSNGVWTFEPLLTCGCLLEALSRFDGLAQAGSGVRPAADGGRGEFVYRVDAGNIICHAEVSGTCDKAAAGDSILIHFSADSVNWIPIDTVAAAGAFTQEFGTQGGLMLARTRSSYFLKVTLKAAAAASGCGLTAFKVVTTTTVNPRMLPKLTLGANRVRFVKGSGSLSAPPELRYYWTEYKRGATGVDAVPRSHKKTLSDSVTEYLINVDGFRNPVMDSIRYGWAAMGESHAEGYRDGVDPGAGNEAPRYYYTFGKNIAAGKIVTSTPTAVSVAYVTDNNTTPVTYSAGANPEIVIDLGSAQNAAGVRLGQQLGSGNAEYLDSAEVFTSGDNAAFTSQGRFYYRQVWEPITNYLHPNDWDAMASLAQRHAKITFNKFSRVFDAGSVSARYIKVKIWNTRGAVGIVEIEVYDNMTRTKVVNELDHGFTLPDPGLVAAEQGLIAAEQGGLRAPVQGSLIMALPNPAGRSSIISIQVPALRQTPGLTLSVLDAGGSLVTMLSRQDTNGGYEWKTEGRPAGIYFIKASWKGGQAVRAVTLLR